MITMGSPSAGARSAFASEIADSLRRHPRQLPAKYFYDALGSALFDAICCLPWYGVTRAELGLLERHAVDMLHGLRRPLTIGELGCGSGDKLAVLAARAGERFEALHLADISPAALHAARRRLDNLRCGPVVLHAGAYEDGVAAIRAVRRNGAMVVLFLGSNIGNFEPAPARELLARIRGALVPGDALLLGTDLVKPESDLLLAYDDPLQVTAAFNRNILRRINDELGGTFDLDAWSHRAVWHAGCRRIEMHLVSRSAQRVRIADAGLDLTFAEGETIWTESSYKYEPDEVERLGRAAGFGHAVQWMDDSARFALTRFSV